MKFVSHQETDQCVTAAKRLLSEEELRTDAGPLKTLFATTLRTLVTGAKAESVGILLLVLARYALKRFRISSDKRILGAARDFFIKELDHCTVAELTHTAMSVAHLASTIAAEFLSGMPIELKKDVITYDFRHDGHAFTRESAVKLHLVRTFESATSAFIRVLEGILLHLVPQGTVRVAVREGWPILICDLSEHRQRLLAKSLLTEMRGRILLVTRTMNATVRDQFDSACAIVRDSDGVIGPLFGTDSGHVVVIEPRIGGYTVTQSFGVLLKPKSKHTRMLTRWKESIQTEDVPEWLKLLSAVRYPNALPDIDNRKE